MTWNLDAPVIKGKVGVINRTTGKTTIVEVSTSAIPNLPETCLFWSDDNWHRHSKIVQTYDTWDEAREGHAKWVNDPYRIAKTILDNDGRLQ